MKFDYQIILSSAQHPVFEGEGDSSTSDEGKPPADGSGSGGDTKIEEIALQRNFAKHLHVLEIMKFRGKDSIWCRSKLLKFGDVVFGVTCFKSILSESIS